MFFTLVAWSIPWWFFFSSYFEEVWMTLKWTIETQEIVSWEKHIAITFDDGPNPIYTPQILGILKSHHVPATFFTLGNRIRKHEKLLKHMKDEGFEIANHSYIHPMFSRIPTVRYLTEVWYTDLMIWSSTGKWPTFFRFPYGDEDRRIGLFHRGPIIGWNVDANDWKEKNPKKLARNIIHQTASGSIILLHDIREDTLNALPEILEWLQKQGFVFVSLRSLIHYDEQRNYTNIHYRSATLSGAVQSRKKEEKNSPTSIPTSEGTPDQGEASFPRF